MQTSTEHAYWCVSLKGDDWFLKLLAREEECAWHIEEEDGTYYLVAPEFQECSEAGEVWRLAQELVPQLDRAAGLVFNNYSGISIDKPFEVFQNGARKGTAFVAFRVGAVAGARTAMHVRGSRSYVRDAYEMVTADHAVEEVSHYWGVRDRSWTLFLWKIYEVIRRDQADEQNLLLSETLGRSGRRWVDAKEFERFDAAVHDRRASGIDARHATPRKPQPHPNPMDRNEAERFINRLIRQWITWKHDQQHT